MQLGDQLHTPQAIGGWPSVLLHWLDKLRRVLRKHWWLTIAFVGTLTVAIVVTISVLDALYPQHKGGSPAATPTNEAASDEPVPGGIATDKNKNTPQTQPKGGGGSNAKPGNSTSRDNVGASSPNIDTGNGNSSGGTGGDTDSDLPSCSLPKYPTPDCTGVPADTSLATINGNITLSTPGQILDGVLVTGSVTVVASNVVIKNSEIHGRIHNTNGQSFTIQDSLVGPTSGCLNIEAVGYENYTARRVQMRNVSDGFRVSGDNITIEDSYILLCSQPGDHSDGIQGYFGGMNVRIDHNTIDQRHALDSTAPIFFADNSKSATITNNLLMGGGYTLRIHDDAGPDIGPWIITGNRIVSGSWEYDPVSTTNTECSGVTWSDNRLVTIDSSYDIVSTGSMVACTD